jgi:hypothetical protein
VPDLSTASNATAPAQPWPCAAPACGSRYPPAGVVIKELASLPPGRPSRGRRPRALLLALLSPILRGLSRLYSTALRLAPGRVGGAAAPPWARRSIRGEGWPAHTCRVLFLFALLLLYDNDEAFAGEVTAPYAPTVGNNEIASQLTCRLTLSKIKV